MGIILVTPALGASLSLCSAAIRVSVWEMSSWQRIKVRWGIAMGSLFVHAPWHYLVLSAFTSCCVDMGADRWQRADCWAKAQVQTLKLEFCNCRTIRAVFMFIRGWTLLAFVTLHISRSTNSRAMFSYLHHKKYFNILDGTKDCADISQRIKFDVDVWVTGFQSYHHILALYTVSDNVAVNIRFIAKTVQITGQ